MSHYTCLVIVDKGGELEDQLAAALAPFDENDESVCEAGNNKWDWYSVGGRWNNVLTGTGNVANVADLQEGIETKIYAYLTPDGQWHEKGKMGWFGMASNETPNEEWYKYARNLLVQNNDKVAVLVDLHI